MHHLMIEKCRELCGTNSSRKRYGYGNRTAEALALAKLELFGTAGEGRMAVLLVHEHEAVLRFLPRPLNALSSKVAETIRAICRKAEQAKGVAEELDNLAHAERMEWLVTSLRPERLWLAWRDYALRSCAAS